MKNLPIYGTIIIPKRAKHIIKDHIIHDGHLSYGAIPLSSVSSNISPYIAFPDIPNPHTHVYLFTEENRKPNILYKCLITHHRVDITRHTDNTMCVHIFTEHHTKITYHLKNDLKTEIYDNTCPLIYTITHSKRQNITQCQKNELLFQPHYINTITIKTLIHNRITHLKPIIIPYTSKMQFIPSSRTHPTKKHENYHAKHRTP